MNQQTFITSTQLNKLQQLKQKVRLISDDIYFLKQCKKNKVFPKFINIKISIKSSITEKVLHNAKLNQLNLEIKYLYAKQSNLQLEAYEQHLLISRSLNNIYFNLFDEKYTSILQTIEFKHENKVRKLNKKLQSLKEHNKQCTTQDILPTDK